MYCPPVSGIMQPISAFIIAPNKEIVPATIHSNNNNRGEDSCAAITAGFIKMLLPMTEPITMDIETHSPNFRSSFAAMFMCS